MVLRRRDGIRPMSLVVDFCPDRSVSVSTASLRAGSTKPCSIEPVATWTTEGAGTPFSAPAGSASRAGMPSPPSTSTMRAAGPWPSVTNTARQPSDSQPLVSASARAVSPR